MPVAWFAGQHDAGQHEGHDILASQKRSGSGGCDSAAFLVGTPLPAALPHFAYLQRGLFLAEGEAQNPPGFLDAVSAEKPARRLPHHQRGQSEEQPGNAGREKNVTPRRVVRRENLLGSAQGGLDRGFVKPPQSRSQ